MATYAGRTIAYAERVVRGEETAGRYERAACKRFLDDLARQNTDGFPYVFDEKAGARACKFIELLPHIKGRVGAAAVRRRQARLHEDQTRRLAGVHRDQPLRMEARSDRPPPFPARVRRWRARTPSRRWLPASCSSCARPTPSRAHTSTALPPPATGRAGVRRRPQHGPARARVPGTLRRHRRQARHHRPDDGIQCQTAERRGLDARRPERALRRGRRGCTRTRPARSTT